MNLGETISELETASASEIEIWNLVAGNKRLTIRLSGRSAQLGRERDNKMN